MKFQKRRLSHRNGDGRFYTGEEESWKRYIKAAISEISQRNISLPLLFVQKQQSCGGSFAGNFFKSTAFAAG